MFLSKNKKNNVYPCKPQFYCIKVGFKGVKIGGEISLYRKSVSKLTDRFDMTLTVLIGQ